MHAPESTTPRQFESPENVAHDPELAQENRMTPAMDMRHSPLSAQYLRECIAHELEKAERILLERLGIVGSEQQLLDAMEARCALARSWH